MTKIWVEYSDSTKAVIASVYPAGLGGQDEDGDIPGHPNAAQIDLSDPTYLAWYNQMPIILRDGVPAPEKAQ